MAYRLCTSLPSWLEGFDPPYPLHFFGGIPERPKGADCKSASTSFDGSNPSSTTIFYNTAPQARCFFLHRGGEDRSRGAGTRSGTEANQRDRQREAMSMKCNEGNPSSTTIFGFKGQCPLLFFIRCANLSSMKQNQSGGNKSYHKEEPSVSRTMNKSTFHK